MLARSLVALMRLGGARFEFEGETFDCGDKLGLLLANVAHGLADESIGPAFRAALIEKISREYGASQRPRVSVPELIAV